MTVNYLNHRVATHISHISALEAIMSLHLFLAMDLTQEIIQARNTVTLLIFYLIVLVI